MSDLDLFMWTKLPGKCPFCGQDTVYKENIVLTSLPPQFRYECKSCGKTWTAHSDYEALHTSTPAAAGPSSSSRTINNYIGNDFPISWGQQGWVCPKCGRVNAPHVNHCPCSEPGTTTISTGTTPNYNLLPKTICVTDTGGNTVTVASTDWIQPYIDAVENASAETLTEQEKDDLLKNITVTDCEVCGYSDLVSQKYNKSTEDENGQYNSL